MDRSRNIIITLIIVVTILVIALAGVIIYFTLFQKNNNNNNNIVVDYGNNLNTNTNELENTIGNNIVEDSENLAIEAFNSTFKMYEGTNLNSLTIKNLFSSINTNNTTRTDEHIVAIDNQGITNVSNIDDTKTYDVVLSYDNEGYVNSIKITETTTANPTVTPTVGEQGNDNTQNDFEKLLFNSKFTNYQGEINGVVLGELFNVLLDSNSKNPNHQIGYTSNNLTQVTEFRQQDLYVITLQYDSNGFVNNINIDAKI